MVSPFDLAMEARVVVERIAGAGDVRPHLADGVAVSMTSMRKMLSVFSRSFRGQLAQQLGAGLGLERRPGRLRGLGGRDPRD